MKGNLQNLLAKNPLFEIQTLGFQVVLLNFFARLFARVFAGIHLRVFISRGFYLAVSIEWFPCVII